jgi:hypothetical protein
MIRVFAMIDPMSTARYVKRDDFARETVLMSRSENTPIAGHQFMGRVSPKK